MSKQCKRKLTEEKIQKVRELYATGEWTQKQLVEKVGVSKDTIGKYVKGVKKSKLSFEQKLWSYIDKRKDDECWPYTARLEYILLLDQ